jgi:transcriptional regulator with XRE-family HTH domain
MGKVDVNLVAQAGQMVSRAKSARLLEHDPEKWKPVFGQRSCSNKEIENDSDSTKSQQALDPDLREMDIDRPVHAGEYGPMVPAENPFGHGALLQAAIGRTVRDYRKRHDLNGADLAKAAGISFGMLSRIENGTVSPSLGTLQSISSAIGVPVTALLDRYNEQSRAVFVTGAARGVPCPAEGEIPAPFLRDTSSIVPLAQEAFIVAIDRNGTIPSDFEAGGTFFVHCLGGEVIYSHIARHCHMAPGDSLTFEAFAPHGVSKALRVPARLLVVRTCTEGYAPKVNGAAGKPGVRRQR